MNSSFRFHQPGAVLPTAISTGDHFTPFGARVNPPPVIVLPRRHDRLYRLFAVVTPLLWAASLLMIGHLAFQAGSAVVALDRQMAMADRV